MEEGGEKTIPGIHICDIGSGPTTVEDLMRTVGHSKPDDMDACMPRLSTSCGVPVLRSIPVINQWFGPNGCVTGNDIEAKVFPIIKNSM